MDTWTDPDLGRVSGSGFEDLFWIPSRLVSTLFCRGVSSGMYVKGSSISLGTRGNLGPDVGLANVATSPPGMVVLGVLGIVFRLSGILA